MKQFTVNCKLSPDQLTNFFFSGQIRSCFYGRVDVDKDKQRPRKGARKARKIKDVPQSTLDHIKELNANKEPFWFSNRPSMSFPLARTPHPANQFAKEDEAFKVEIEEKAKCDAPVDLQEDPYIEEPITCILCPRRYAMDIRPSWRNPKLLSQFVSPHTGLVYKKHITGLCEFMQDEVEREVKRAQKMGYMSTKMRDVIYLKDPALFDPTRPTRKNPH